MDINKILTADILDILFEGKNKEYGAYDLRKTYDSRIKKALLGMLIVSALFAGYNILFAKEKKETNQILVEDVNLEKLKEPPPPEPPPPPPPPKQEPPKIEVAQFTPPKIVPKEEVKEPPPDVEKLEESKIDNFNQKGEKAPDVVEAPKEVTTGGPAPVEEDYNKLFTSVQIESEYPGGMGAWKSYLERNLNVESVRENGAPPGKITVAVSFIVDKEGKVSEIAGELVGGGSNDFGSIEEAIRVIKRSNAWKPGVQNGIQVKSRKRQLISFQINDE